MRLRNKKTGGIYEADYMLGINVITELSEYWEVYKPTEPLIKDEKIRKAVRIWAEVNKTKYVWVTVAFDGTSITQDERHPFPTEYKQSITFECEVNVKSGYYTIEELCGEEEG